MPIIQWQESYATGIQIIDDQHRQLFQTINELFDLIQTDAALPQILGNLDFLLAYAVNHFQTEESFMAESGYPDLSEHHDEHRRLVERIHTIRARFSTPEPPTPLELSRMVSEWTSHHIGEVDMGYASFLKRRGEA
ncbi:MAG: hemerythrin family protein [Holophaga sp.]|nr:hemerythrin family protein [Holophaga sp.]